MEDLKRIVDAAKATGLREYAFVRFLAETGCRLGGILHLKLEDMDLDLGWAVVSEKGEKTRNVFCSPETAEALRAWLAIRPDNKGNVVFVGERGSLTKSGVRSMLNRLSEKAGVTGRHNAHSFRHALARRLLFNGADMGTVSRLLGHSNIETTHDFYAIWTERELWLRYRKFGGPI
jgi:site-specific recombinase XerD